MVWTKYRFVTVLVLPVTNFISVPHTYSLLLISLRAELRFEIRIVEDWQITILIETYNLQNLN